MNATASWVLEQGVESTSDWMSSFLCGGRDSCGFLVVSSLKEFTGNLPDIEEEFIDEMEPYGIEMTLDQRRALKAYRNLFKTLPYAEDGYMRAAEIVPYMVDLFAGRENTPADSPDLEKWIEQLQHLIREERDYRAERRQKI